MSIQKLLSNKQYSFRWNGILHDTEIMISIPDISQSTFSVWGDWGPMYSFDIEASHPIKISYNGESYNLEESVLKVESPMLAEIRENYPFFISVNDVSKGLHFRWYLDKDACLKKVEVIRLQDKIKLFEDSFEKYPHFTAA